MATQGQSRSWILLRNRPAVRRASSVFYSSIICHTVTFQNDAADVMLVMSAVYCIHFLITWRVRHGLLRQHMAGQLRKLNHNRE